MISSTGRVVLEGIKSVWDRFQLGIDLNQGWAPFINSQLKWSVSWIIRVSAVALSVVVVVLIVKYSGVKNMVLQDVMEIKPKSSNVISSPNINYDKDLKSIDSVLKMMESKKSK